MKMNKKALAVLLAVCMIASSSTMGAFAATKTSSATSSTTEVGNTTAKANSEASQTTSEANAETLEAAKGRLNNAIESTSSRQQNDYTEATWSTLSNALEKAEGVQNGTDLTEITSATETLQSAISGLEKKPAIPSGGGGSVTPSAPSTDTTPVAATVTVASTNPTVKAVLDKIVNTKDDASIVATFKKSDKKISITATALAGQDVYMYKLIGNTLSVVSNQVAIVDKSGVLTLDNPEAASTTKKATAAADDTVTYVLIPASEKPPVASVSGVVKVAQGNTVLFDVTSGTSTDKSFVAGNGAVSETRLYTAYKDGKASYGVYGHGKPGEVTGMYVNGVKLFEVAVVAAPYKSDTTVNITNKKHGAMYWFKITPDDTNAKVAYTAGNGKVLSTRSKGQQKDGSYLFGFQITGNTGEKSGVYVEIDGQHYCVFNVTVK